MNPLISIIIPAYNCADTLRRAVFSALGQTYNNIEIIIVDDGSTDNTPALCDFLKNEDERIYVIHKKNGRQASARNAGLRISQGEYVLFLDGDDEYEPDLCEKIVCILDEYTDIILYGFKVYHKGKLLRTPNSGVHLYENDDWRVFNNYIYVLMTSPCNKLYRRGYITTLFDETCVHGEDAIFNYANFRKGVRICTMSDCLYKVHLDNLTSVNKSYKSGRFADSIKSILCIEKKLEEVFALSPIDRVKIQQRSLTRMMSECYGCFASFPFDVAKSEMQLHIQSVEVQKIMRRNTPLDIIYLRPLLALVKYRQYRIASLYCAIIRVARFIWKR